MSLGRDIEDMRKAALVLDRAQQGELARLLREIADASLMSGGRDEAPMMERLRWTPVVTHAAQLARGVMTTANALAEQARTTSELFGSMLDLDRLT